MPTPRIDVRNRFWSKVDRLGPTDCWRWLAGYSASGYGAIKRDRKQCGAHRVAYELTYGPVPVGLLVCHTCDHRWCCNPSHMFLGTKGDNIIDAVKKQRLPHMKLTDNDARDIRRRAADGESKPSLARDYGVHPKTIWQVVDRFSFKHVE